MKKKNKFHHQDSKTPRTSKVKESKDFEFLKGRQSNFVPEKSLFWLFLVPWCLGGESLEVLP
jgi:hypothetical protein